MKDKKYLVIANYDSNLIKRQPWYSVSYFVEKLEEKYECHIISDLKDVPSSFTGEVIKVFSLKDILQLTSLRKRQYSLTYFCSLPVYNFSDFNCLGIMNIFRNIADLYRLMIISLIPKEIINKVFSKADSVIFISDQTFNLFHKLDNKYHLIPFKRNNWTGLEMMNLKKDKIAYLGPPFETRGFDVALKLFNQASNHEFKVITRIERESLEKRISRYRNNNEKVKFVLGMLTREELLNELSDVKVLVLPFKIVMSELPIVVLEAAELGIQIITTEECGVSTLKNFPGLIVDKKDLSLELFGSFNACQNNHAFLEEIDNINKEFWVVYNGKN